MDNPTRPRFDGPRAVIDQTGTPIESHPSLAVAKLHASWANDHEERCGRSRSHDVRHISLAKEVAWPA
jgi:hypothetical protein